MPVAMHMLQSGGGGDGGGGGAGGWSAQGSTGSVGRQSFGKAPTRHVMAASASTSPAPRSPALWYSM